MIGVALISALVTLLVSVLPFASFAYRSQGAHVAIETAASIIALLAALIVVGRFVRSHEQSDLLLCAAMLILGVTNLVFSALPAVVTADVGPFAIWSPLAGRTLAAAVLLAAAVTPGRRVRRPRRALIRTVVLIAAGLVAIAVVTTSLDSGLPSGIDRELSPESSGRPRVVGPVGLLVTYALIAVMYAVASVGFTRRAERTQDELMTWFAAGAAVAAFSGLNYFLFPSIYSNWVYTGDLLRLAFYLLLLAGAAREIGAYQSQLRTATAFEERRRMARDLHDGLAQELAFIASQSHRLQGGPRDDIARLVGQAADRALEESRTVISTLSRPADADLPEAIARTARELAGRSDVDVTLDLDPDATATLADLESLARITGEAVNNAVRHGAQRLWVTLEQDDDLQLTIRDDGDGFDVDARDGEGFGLRSMRERAESLGGKVGIISQPGQGATIKVRVP